jgi:competence protein ComEC
MNQALRRCTENLLICATVCFILGASTAYSCASQLAHLPITVIVAPALLALAIIAYVLQSQLRLLTTLPFFFFIGLLHTHLALQPPKAPRDIANLVTEKTKVSLIGRILTMVEYDGEKARFTLASEAMLMHNSSGESAFQPVQGKIQLYVQGSLGPQFTPGTKILAIATVDRISNYQTPGAFNYRLLMATQSISCSGWVHSPKEILQLHQPPLSPWQRLGFFPEQVRQHVAHYLGSQLDRDLAGIYQALLIGSRVNIPVPILETFKINGCMHILAISGLHLSLLGVFATTFLGFCIKRSEWLLLHTHVPTLTLLLTAPFLIFYAFIAGMNTPAIRALVTALLVVCAVLSRRQRSLPHLIAAAALTVLAITPLALFTASFQLSFAAVLAIITLYPKLPLHIKKGEPGHRTSHISTGLKIFQSLFYVSLAATAGTLPFMLYHFNRFSLIGPMMNVIIEPLLCLWALPCGLLGIACIPTFPNVAALLFKLGGMSIQLAVSIATTAADIPYAAIWTITPSPLEIALYFLLLFLTLYRRPTIRRLLPILLVSIALLCNFTLSLWRPSKNKELIVSFLDVGQGTATLLQLPNGTNILIDGGGRATERFNPGQNIIAPYLWRQRIWRVDNLIVTHPHQDHYNGLPFIYAHFQPQRLIINGDSGTESTYSQFLQDVRKNKTLIQVATAGDILLQDVDLRLECLGMNGSLNQVATWSTNDRSLVLRLQHGKRSFLFPGDISIQSENKLLHHGDRLRADVLLAPHHGSITSSSHDFISAVSPEIITVSTGLARKEIQPATEHLRHWRKEKRTPLVTAHQGTITCSSDGKTLRTRTFTGDRYFSKEQKRSNVGEK